MPFSGKELRKESIDKIRENLPVLRRVIQLAYSVSLTYNRACSHYFINNSPISIPNVNKGNNDSPHKSEDFARV
jgi:hypothetical protein